MAARSEYMKKEPPQEVVPPISSTPNRPLLRKDDREVPEAWLIGSLGHDQQIGSTMSI